MPRCALMTLVVTTSPRHQNFDPYRFARLEYADGIPIATPFRRAAAGRRITCGRAGHRRRFVITVSARGQPLGRLGRHVAVQRHVGRVSQPRAAIRETRRDRRPPRKRLTISLRFARRRWSGYNRLRSFRLRPSPRVAQLHEIVRRTRGARHRVGCGAVKLRQVIRLT